MEKSSSDNAKRTELSLEKVVREALKDQRYTLKVQPENDASWILLLDEEKVKIGRSADCEIALNDTNVSREHALVYLENEEYIIEDLNSTNGTFLNEVKIVRSVLRPNDTLRIGKYTLLFDYRED